MATERKGVSVSDFASGIFDLDGATEYQNWMVYGDSGCGKTALAATLPGRLMFWAGEPGHITAARMGARGSVRLIPDTATAVAATAWMEGGRAKDYDWLIVDGLSTMNEKFLLGYAAEAFDANPTKRAHRNLPDRPDYFNTQNFTKSWVARIIDLPINVLFTAHAMRPEDERGETLVYPSIQGKGYQVSNYVAGLMHVVAYMANRVTADKNGAVQSRRLLFRNWIDPDGTRYFAKDQFSALPHWATVRDPENPKGMSMPELLALCASAEPTAAKARKARAGKSKG